MWTFRFRLLPYCLLFRIRLHHRHRVPLDNIQFHWVEAYDFQISSAFFARYYVALVRVCIDMNVGIAFRTGSGRHFLYLQLRNFTAGCTRDSVGETLPY